MPFQILLTEDAEKDLDSLRASDRRNILEGMQTHLETEPTRTSRSRIKKLVQPAMSQYRLRVGDFRVYYDVVEAAGHVVVLHIWEKGRQSTPDAGEA